MSKSNQADMLFAWCEPPAHEGHCGWPQVSRPGGVMKRVGKRGRSPVRWGLLFGQDLPHTPVFGGNYENTVRPPHLRSQRILSRPFVWRDLIHINTSADCRL
jgi:hypothetical protein